MLENVVLDEDRDVDYTDTSITQNTRGAYPIEFIHNAKIPCMAGHPTDVIFLTCDAFGVLPPVSALSPAHAMYHFISGYTAKVAGTEMGVTEPQATFSPCFGGPFLVWHPSKYAELLAEKMQQAQRARLAREHRLGRRRLRRRQAHQPQEHPRHHRRDPRRLACESQKGARSGVRLRCRRRVPDVPSEILIPRNAWADKAAYDATAKKLAGLFNKNFETYAAGASAEVKAAAPVIMMKTTSGRRDANEKPTSDKRLVAALSGFCSYRVHRFLITHENT